MGMFDMDKHLRFCLVPVGSAAVVKLGVGRRNLWPILL